MVSTKKAETMKPRRYRLNRATLGVCSDGDKKCCITVPDGEIIRVQIPDILANRQTLEIEWGGRVLTVFTQDILARGTALDDPSTENTNSRLPAKSHRL
jgi:hypothetical protein